MLDRLIELCLKSRFLRVILDRLNARALANGWLRRCPQQRILADSGIKYRMRSIDSLLVAREIFRESAYRGLLPLDNISYFADVGCNCGFFTCFLMDALGRRDPFALLLDANPRMVEETNWHIAINDFRNARAVWGIAGGKAKLGSEGFYLHTDDAVSSRFAKSPPSMITRGRWRRIEAPSISLANEWRRHFGEATCDLLKIDIEGSESEFVANESDLIRSTRLVLIEVHHWLVNLTSIEKRITSMGFELSKIFSTNPEADVRLYKNKATTQP